MDRLLFTLSLLGNWSVCGKGKGPELRRTDRPWLTRFHICHQHHPQYCSQGSSDACLLTCLQS